MINTLSQNVLTLTEKEQARLFGIIRDHADVLRKIIPDLPILEAVYADNLDDSDDPVVRAYLIWKSKQQ